MMSCCKGILIGTVLGAALATAGGMCNPEMRRSVMKQGKSLAKMYRRKLQYLDLF